MDSKIKRKASKNKDSEASKRGRRNKRAGYSSEKRLEKLFNKWGFICKRVPLSGALKTEGLDSDLRITIRNIPRKIENKRRADFTRFYKLVSSKKAVMIEGFCVLMEQEVFHGLLLGIQPEVEVIEDKRFKGLHDYFDQDGADIVSMTSSYKPYIFAVTLELWEELIK